MVEMEPMQPLIKHHKFRLFFLFCRLGQAWKRLSTEEKAEYFDIADQIRKEHKRKYPGM
jgi:HMG (high mobility group) box.